MEGIVKEIVNDIYIYEKGNGMPGEISYFTVANLEKGVMVDLTDIMFRHWGKMTLGKRRVRRLNQLKKGKSIAYFYDENTGLNKPLPGTFYVDR